MSRFLPSDEEAMVRDAARAFVTDRMPVAAVRAVGDEGFDRAAWREMAALGWPGIAIATTHGGSGLGIRALLGVIEEMGRNLAASPLAASALVVATAIARFGDAATRDRWLPAIARGEIVAALAAEDGDDPTRRDGLTLHGGKRFVAEGVAADLLAVACSDGSLALLRADAPGVTVTRTETTDGRGLADIRYDSVTAEALLSAGALDHALDCARIGLSAEMLGAATQAFETTLDYLRTRRQFGQAIGSFQALQHRAAKLFVEIELTRSCVLAAADALHHHAADVPQLASLAKASANALMRQTAYEMIQLHGGIGMTDAHNAGLYLKRWRVAALLHGNCDFHVDRYARLKGY